MLLYDLGIAYVGAFTFYLLIIRLPLRRNRRNVYQYLAPLINRVVGEARNLIGTLNSAAGFDDSRENSLANVEVTCAKVTAAQRVGLLVPAPAGGLEKATLMDAIHFHMARARKVDREILDRSDYLDAEVVNLITAVENYGYFTFWDNIYPMYQRGLLKPDENMSFIARNIFDYLQTASKVDAYIQEHLPTAFQRPSYLVSGSIRDSDEIPLQRYVRPEAATGGASIDFVAPTAAEHTETTQSSDEQQEPPATPGEDAKP
jgi:hypothetical protein